MAVMEQQKRKQSGSRRAEVERKYLKGAGNGRVAGRGLEVHPKMGQVSPGGGRDLEAQAAGRHASLYY